MIALWMVYVIAVTAALGAGASLVESAAGAAGRPRRWFWMVALVLAVAIPAWTALRPDFPIRSSDGKISASASTARASAPAASAFTTRLAELIARADGAEVSARWNTPLAWLWGLTAVLAVSAYGAATWSLARARRSWRAAEVDGQPVLLAASTGPAVVGAFRPQIVVPEWTLGLPAERRALILAHEREHVRARDPLLLHAAAFIALVMPWNLAAWWLNRRLRVAVELDCDARVLMAGRDPVAYGTLLLDVCARRARRGAVLAPALFERGTSLTRRILAMHPTRTRFPRARIALGTTAALAAVVLACEMPAPEVLAPDGKNAPATRLYGKDAGATRVAPSDLRATVARFFPAVARGEGGPSILFIVRSPDGEIVMTGAERANTLLRRPQAETEISLRATPTPTELAARQRAELAQAERARIPGARESGLGAFRLRTRQAFREAAGPVALPSGIDALRPDDIQAIEVEKHAAGAIAPEPLSVVTVTLKPGVRVPANGPRF